MLKGTTDYKAMQNSHCFFPVQLFPLPLPLCPFLLLPSPIGHALDDARQYGWDFSQEVTHNWSKMVENVQAHVGSLNWGYRVALRDKNVKYINALATLEDAHTIKVRRE